MNGKNSLGEFYLEDLSYCLDCRSASNTDDESDSSSIAIRKQRPVPLIYSDSEDEDMNNNVEDNNDNMVNGRQEYNFGTFQGQIWRKNYAKFLRKCNGYCEFIHRK